MPRLENYGYYFTLEMDFFWGGRGFVALEGGFVAELPEKRESGSSLRRMALMEVCLSNLITRLLQRGESIRRRTRRLMNAADWLGLNS